MSRLTKGTEFKIETRAGLILINDKPISITCKLLTKNDGYYQFNMINPINKFDGNITKYRNFLKLGSFLEVLDTHENKSIISFSRKDRGKVNIINHVTNQHSIIDIKKLVEDYPILLRIVFGDAPFKENNKEKSENLTSNAVLEKKIEEKIESTMTDSEVFILKDNIKNGKNKITQVNMSVKNKKPSIEICDSVKGFSKATLLKFSYKKGNRTKYERVEIDFFKSSSWKKMFDELINGNVRIIEVTYWGKPYRYTMNLFTIEYVQNKFLFSYTLSKENHNHETIYFAEINEEGFIQKEEYAMNIISCLFNKTEEEFPSYMQSILVELNKKEDNNKPEILQPYYEWAKEKGFSLDYLQSYDVNKVANVLKVVKKGFDNLDKIIEYDKYKPLYSLVVQNTNSFYGFYYHKSSKLAFSLNLFNESTISTVYHEYGHLIYYSLMNKQIMTEEIAAKNEQLLKTFLSNYKNCSYIQYFKEKRVNSSKLSYYREDTELFARFFESFVLLQTGQYEEISSNKNALNTKEECEDFISFVNNHFNMNLCLNESL